MKKINLEKTRCNLCKSNNYRVIQKPLPFKIVKCKKCNLIYVNPRPTQKYIKKLLERKK